MKALLLLVQDFDRAFAAAKRRANLVDYADLEHMTASLLLDEDGAPTELARQVSSRWEEILVDEYQDVSRVQDDIFRALSREGSNLFLVGDVKQSIYRFRLADPTIFTEKYERYADEQGRPRRAPADPAAGEFPLPAGDPGRGQRGVLPLHVQGPGRRGL